MPLLENFKRNEVRGSYNESCSIFLVAFDTDHWIPTGCYSFATQKSCYYTPRIRKSSLFLFIEWIFGLHIFDFISIFSKSPHEACKSRPIFKMTSNVTAGDIDFLHPLSPLRVPLSRLYCLLNPEVVWQVCRFGFLSPSVSQ